MSYAIKIVPERRTAFFRFSGEVDAREARQAFLDYIRSPGFDPTHTMVTDARDVTEMRIRFGEVVAGVIGLMRALTVFKEPVRSIILVSDADSYVRVRLLDQVLETASNIRVEVVRDEGEALTKAGHAGESLATLMRGAA
ncbi:hypothetical protein [Maritimibacter sp. UBA3975]|uniref:hypothetical protein n=1 Tax=Maritimibacter sp. UBA3975 TaxID=1946833 RepID=UPI000C09BD7D|nr:hypothetical protein [Maritimibacter sp. UBA3975]MAM61879.1 hypothetical protein [Maritimibacter sp.]